MLKIAWRGADADPYLAVLATLIGLKRGIYYFKNQDKGLGEPVRISFDRTINEYAAELPKDYSEAISKFINSGLLQQELGLELHAALACEALNKSISGAQRGR